MADEQLRIKALRAWAPVISLTDKKSVFRHQHEQWGTGSLWSRCCSPIQPFGV